jgi:hypothetical protein
MATQAILSNPVIRKSLDQVLATAYPDGVDSDFLIEGWNSEGFSLKLIQLHGVNFPLVLPNDFLPQAPVLAAGDFGSMACACTSGTDDCTMQGGAGYAACAGTVCPSCRLQSSIQMKHGEDWQTYQMEVENNYPVIFAE